MGITYVEREHNKMTFLAIIVTCYILPVLVAEAVHEASPHPTH
jgi:hypothetical protein